MTAERSQQIETDQLDWRDTDTRGVQRRAVAEGVAGGHEVAVYRLAPGAALPAREGHGLEVLVLTGDWSTARGRLGPGGYARQVLAGGGSSEAGCTLFVRSGPVEAGDSEEVFAPTEERRWAPGHGNLEVLPLHAFGTEGTALVRWPAGERFIPHRHMGGEEIFVLSGVFEDEHGRYPAGTWLLSPHLSAHHPFVKEETVIYVKTGHLAPEPIR